MLTNKECDHCPIVKPFHPKEIREHEDCLPHFCHVVHPRGVEGVAAICQTLFGYFECSSLTFEWRRLGGLQASQFPHPKSGES